MKFTCFCLTISSLFLLPGCTTSQPAAHSQSGYQPIFDGQTLRGWEYDSTYWHVREGVIVGEITPATIVKRNTFLIWRGGQPRDFELLVDYRISALGNSGINYRSEDVPGLPCALKGYQADLDGRNRYTGQNYEERGRKFLAYRGQRVRLLHLVVRGNHLQHYLNGVLMADVTDDDPANRKLSGWLGVQVHVGPPMKIEYRNFLLKTLR